MFLTGYRFETKYSRILSFVLFAELRLTNKTQSRRDRRKTPNSIAPKTVMIEMTFFFYFFLIRSHSSR